MTLWKESTTRKKSGKGKAGKNKDKHQLDEDDKKLYWNWSPFPIVKTPVGPTEEAVPNNAKSISMSIQTDQPNLGLGFDPDFEREWDVLKFVVDNAGSNFWNINYSHSPRKKSENGKKVDDSS